MSAFRVPGFIPNRCVDEQNSNTWTPQVCKIMAFMAVIMGLGLLFYILLGFRQYLKQQYARKNRIICSERGTVMHMH